MKKRAALLLSVLLCVLFFGCESRPPLPEGTLSGVESGPVTLRVLTEEGSSRYFPDGDSELVSAIKSVAAYYGSAHENVTVKVEVLPTTEKAREAALEKLREEIKAGKGPDVYLLPTGVLETPDDYLEKSEEYKKTGWFEKIEEGQMPSLFLDVEIAMRNDAFADVSAFYDKDEALNKDELNQTIMEAGVYDGKRYVLPLGYSIPVVYANKALSDEMKMNLKDPETRGIAGLTWSAAVASDLSGKLAPKWGVTSIDPADALSFLPHLYDYDENRLTLASDNRLNSYFSCYWGYSIGNSLPNIYETVGEYLEREKFSLESVIPFRVAGLGGAADQIGLCKYLGIEPAVFPLLTYDETLVATVTYYGAVGAGCEHPEVAYDFLRLFLFPHVQFGLGLGEEYPTGLTDAAQTGWPIRTVGSVDAVWKQVTAIDGGEKKELLSKIAKTELSDSDLPVLDAEITEVRFPNGFGSFMAETRREIDNSITSSQKERDEKLQKIITGMLEKMNEYMAEALE